MARGKESDHFSKRAKKEGRPARSIYKLEAIDKKVGLLRKGIRVLDLGCSPGSWIQYAAERVGSGGWVLGYDLKPVEVSLPAHAEARIGDAFELDPTELGGKFRVLMSDMAPATSGDHGTDALRSAALVERALDVAELHLERGGHVVLKILEGRDVPAIVDRMRITFEKVQRIRPEATRKHSTEIFLVGLGKRE